MAKKAIFQDPIFHDEDKAREALEAELWPNGPTCRHCGNADPEKIAKMQGKCHRPGLYYCHECEGQFTVTVGTVLERSKVPLTKWIMAAHMFQSGKNGVSAHEIHRNLGVTYKTAWFMMHRLREALANCTVRLWAARARPFRRMRLIMAKRRAGHSCVCTLGNPQRTCRRPI